MVNLGVTLNEIPDKVAVFVELGQCKNICKECHSAYYIHNKLHPDLYTPLDLIVYKVQRQVHKGANAIVIMGGTNNYDMDTEKLIKLINTLADIAPVGVYSGILDGAMVHRDIIKNSKLTWLKTGEYNAKLGGLNSPTTNQRFYFINPDTRETTEDRGFFINGK